MKIKHLLIVGIACFISSVYSVDWTFYNRTGRNPIILTQVNFPDFNCKDTYNLEVYWGKPVTVSHNMKSCPLDSITFAYPTSNKKEVYVTNTQQITDNTTGYGSLSGVPLPSNYIFDIVDCGNNTFQVVPGNGSDPNSSAYKALPCATNLGQLYKASEG